MGRVREDFAEMVDNSAPLRRLRQHILEPMECLDHSHRGTPRPKKPTGCGRFELDYLIAQTNRSEACINQDFDACGYSRRESEIVRRRHAIENDASVIAPRYSLDDCPVIRHSRSSGELILARPVVKTTIDPTQFSPGHETLESFVDCSSAGDIDEISRGPDHSLPLKLGGRIKRLRTSKGYTQMISPSINVTASRNTIGGSVDLLD